MLASPQEGTRFEAWLYYANRPDLQDKPSVQVQATSVLCSKHFTRDCFTSSDRKRLTRGAVPSVKVQEPRLRSLVHPGIINILAYTLKQLSAIHFFFLTDILAHHHLLEHGKHLQCMRCKYCMHFLLINESSLPCPVKWQVLNSTPSCCRLLPNSSKDDLSAVTPPGSRTSPPASPATLLITPNVSTALTQTPKPLSAPDMSLRKTLVAFRRAPFIFSPCVHAVDKKYAPRRAGGGEERFKVVEVNPDLLCVDGSGGEERRAVEQYQAFRDPVQLANVEIRGCLSQLVER
ncbi:hypothetical protein HPB51_023014 [Rhipicephalus microplus]|uniref:THAP-type domain-containing protein n=1 Tax=Rhipicephalus microplus TaxID=6941 RepID=A0A9J6D6Z4_RHIMP|nr:hypothetical protein HPB51_023014 [Rhipicephalus microplus]